MSVFIGYPSFMAYQMMKGKKDNNDDDGFPSIPGTIARYSALGLTNEEMSKNPVWVDKTGNDHDLQMKNFLWGGMSGVGGYGDENHQTFYKFTLDDYTFIASPPGVKHMNFTFRVTGLQPGNKLTLAFFGTTNTIYGTWNKDGIYTVDADIVEAGKPTYFYNGYGATRGEFTIEILPLYPGFILGDGVDDFAVTEKELNFEDTYTVYTAFIPFQNNPTKNMMMAGKNIKDFYMNYSSLNALSYYSGNKSVVINLSNGFNLLCCKRDADNMTIKNLITGDSVTATANEFINNPGLYYLWGVANGYSYARLAIAGQTICNGYFSTDEDDEKVLDWYKKQYSWLFFDQAWTVTGKTNEDEDRATIANITGNGNDLVLSNFGFAEGSGYGLYGENYNGGRWVKSTDRADITWTSYSVNITSVKVASTQLYYQSYPEQPSFIVPSYKIKVYGLKDGQTLSYKQVTSEGQQIYKISEDGIYTLPSFLFKANGDWYGFTLDKIQETCDITIEQIPEYEGYLMTDGVDDKAVSKQFKFGENFTVILDFKFPVKKIAYCGFDLSSKVRIQNLQGSGVYVVLKGNKTLIPSNVVRAVTSEGKVYDENWNEYNIVPGNISSNYTMVNLGFDGSNQFAESATKLAGIYSSTLSKDDCIKAYNYLQTLKAK